MKKFTIIISILYNYNNMRKVFILITSLILLAGNSLAQGQLKLYPDSIEFKDSFHRLNNVYFINEGSSTITIGNISYNTGAYFVRFNKYWNYPFQLAPGDTLLMDCILQSEYLISTPNRNDTMFVYSDSNRIVGKIKIKIDYYNEGVHPGTINGFISDGISPIANAEVNFFNKNLLIESVFTDNTGFYSAKLPPGNYIVSAQKDSFYVSYFGQQLSPFNASIINLKSDSTQTADIALGKMNSTGFSISGEIYDLTSEVSLKRGIVIVRRGTHTPSKSNSNSLSTNEIYTANIQPDGSYQINNILQTGYYYIQAFSDYYVPAYYSNAVSSPVVWQKADTVLINSSIQNKRIILPRDSSIGAGSVSGKILLNNISDTSNAGVLVLAQSVNMDSSFIAFSFADKNGEFIISNLPYGNYRLIAQKIGSGDVYSSVVGIDSLNNSIAGINMNFYSSGIENVSPLPGDFQLYQNYPNPFNPTTTIDYYQPSGAEIYLHVMNILGQEIKVLKQGFSPAGSHKIIFNASGLNSGVYFIILNVSGKMLVRKILLIK